MASDTSQLRAMAQRLEKVADVLKGDWTDAGNAAGLKSKQAATKAGQSVTGGSGTLRNMGRGAKLGSHYDLEEQGKRLIVQLRKPGPWIIFEQGAKKHDIGPKGGARHQVMMGAMFGGQGAPAVMAPGYEHPVYSVSHPGVRQKRGAITKAFKGIREVATPAYHEAMIKKLSAIYG